MKYLIVQDWKSTQGNHAGMVHMCKLLIDKYPDEYKIIKKESPEKFKGLHTKNMLINLLYSNTLFKFSKYLFYRKLQKSYFKQYMELCQYVFPDLKNGDEIFLLEYNLKDVPQMGLAKYIKKNFPNIPIFALSHLTPSYLRRKYKPSYLLNNDKFVDKELTLGTSLTNYFISIGISKDKISTGFHYVDHEYYSVCKSSLIPKHNITVISMGMLQRNYKLLSLIVNSMPEIDWIICRGRNSAVDKLFVNNTNVKLNGFLSEDDLRDEMMKADISINVLDDTVGSNVITTSMAMGLALVVSDVGSIRDYCDETNAVFCKNNIQSFVEAIRKMSNNKEQVFQMKLSSLEKAKELHIENIHRWFDSLSSSSKQISK